MATLADVNPARVHSRTVSPTRPFCPRPGLATIVAVVCLVLLQLVIVASILTGARDQDTTVSRLDSSMAFYAAEGAMNMGIREMIQYVDDDNDGQSGGVSNNGDPNDDILISPSARAVTARADNGGQTELVANGRAGGSRRRIAVSIAEGVVPGRRIIYSQWPKQSPQFRVWGGANWGAAANTLDFGGQQYWAVIRRCPIRQEVTTVCSLQTKDLQAAVQIDSTWGNLVMATGDCGTIDERPFSFGYEQMSGNGVLAYRKNGSTDIFYRTWNSAVWSAENSTPSLLSSGASFIKLVPKPASNELMLCALSTDASISAMTWNGSSFDNKIVLETAAASGNRECLDAAYESGTGRCLVTWGRAGSNAPHYAVWSGSWSSVSTLPDVGGQAQWIHMASDPAGNRLVIGILDGAGHLSVNSWTGSVWEAYTQVTATAASTSTRCFDVAFEPKGTRGIVVYGHSNTTQPRYRVYDGTTWSAPSQAPSLPGVPLLVQLTPSGGGSEIMMLVNALGGQNRLEFLRWNGSAFVNFQELEPNVSGPAGAEVFMIPDSPPIQVPQLVRGWTEAEP
jgi:hypothetical protein